MKILAAIIEPIAIRKILDHLGIPCEAPRWISARPRGSPLMQADLSGTSELVEIADGADPPSPEG
jgi:hypothetical protein